jgi:hypothetical protein
MQRALPLALVLALALRAPDFSSLVPLKQVRVRVQLLVQKQEQKQEQEQEQGQGLLLPGLLGHQQQLWSFLLDDPTLSRLWLNFCSSSARNFHRTILPNLTPTMTMTMMRWSLTVNQHLPVYPTTFLRLCCCNST